MTDDAKDNTAGDAQRWIATIAQYDREFKKWEARVDKILRRYKDEGYSGRNDGARFNILWSNVQTVVPAVFARLPKPDVSRRFKDQDPVGRVASLILERALEFEIEHYPDYRAALKNCVQDRFLGGRGVSWVRYEPHFKAAQTGEPEDGVQVTEDADEAEPQGEELDYECTPVDYVHWKDFGHSVARTWEEVTAVWRKVYMYREPLVERFGEEIGRKIPLDTKPNNDKKNYGESNDVQAQALIYEIWDKATGKAYWLSKSLGQIVDEKDDPLGLENFFPCPKPLFSTLTTDSLVPTPDFVLYQDQAKELDTLCDRIDGLIKALQVKGVYDASIPELGRLFSEAGNTDLIPVKNWNAFSEKQGLKGAIDLVEILPIAQALAEAYKAMEQVKAQIYEVTGLADIIRGQSDPNETLGAQELKGQYASLRLRSMQNEVAQFAAEVLQIKAQIMCKLFEPESLARIGGADQLSPIDQQLVPQALQLLKQEPLRNFRIEVSADSMVQIDEQAEKEARLEFLKASGQFLQQSAEVGMNAPEMVPLIMEMLKFGVTAFKVGKTIEGQFDQTAEQLKQMAAQPKQTPPDPQLLKVQADQQANQQKLQADQQALQLQMQADAQKQQMEMQMRDKEQQYQAAIEQQRNQLEAQRAELDRQHQAQIEQMKAQMQSQLEAQRIELDKWKAQLDSETKLAIAQISAQSALQGQKMGLDAKAEENKAKQDEQKAKEKQGVDFSKLMQDVTAKIDEMIQASNAPKVIERGPDGKAVSINGRPIQRGPDGKIMGVN